MLGESAVKVLGEMGCTSGERGWACCRKGAGHELWGKGSDHY